MAKDLGFWYSFRERVGNQLQALGKSLTADITTQIDPRVLEARKDGQLPELPPNDLYAGAQLDYDKIRQELAPIGFNPYGFENPQRVVSAIISHMSGQFTQSGLLSQALLTDPKIAGPLNIRSNAMVGLPTTFTPPDDSPDAKDLADICRENWLRWFPASEHGKFHRDLITMGFTRAQMIFKPATRLRGATSKRSKKNGPAPKDARGWFRHPEINTWMPGQYIWWYWDPQRNFGRWLQSDARGTIEPVPGDGQWIFATMSTKQPWVEGLVLSLGLRYAMRLSVALNMTRFATALASGHNVFTGPVQLDGKSLAFIQAQLADPNNLNLLLPSGDPNNRWDAKWTGPNSSGAKDLFLAALEEHGMECAEVILGQNMSTEVKKGSFAAAKAQALVRQDVLEFDALIEESIVNEQILPAVALVNCNDAELAPHMEIVADPATDLFLRAKALHDLAFFLASAPPEVDRAALMVQYGVPMVKSALDTPDKDKKPQPNAGGPKNQAGTQPPPGQHGNTANTEPVPPPPGGDD